MKFAQLFSRKYFRPYGILLLLSNGIHTTEISRYVARFLCVFDQASKMYLSLTRRWIENEPRYHDYVWTPRRPLLVNELILQNLSFVSASNCAPLMPLVSCCFLRYAKGTDSEATISFFSFLLVHC